jgi:hypothetical protein
MAANYAGEPRTYPASRSPKSLNGQRREPAKASGVPTEIPQVRVSSRPHEIPTDTTAFRGTPRYFC